MIITVGCAKGGTGKTASAAALLQAAAMDGLRALGVDFDAQGNLSIALGADTEAAGSLELIEGADAAEVIQHTEQGIDCIAAGVDLATIKAKTGSAYRLQAALEPIRDNYDLIIIDTPPYISDHIFNALQAADGLIIVTESDVFGPRGVAQLAGMAMRFKDSNPQLEILGAIVTKYDGRAKLNREIREQIEDACGALGVPYLGEVRHTVRVRDALCNQVSLYKSAPRSTAAQDYMRIYKEIMKGV